jgi:hypothetical protein
MTLLTGVALFPVLTGMTVLKTGRDPAYACQSLCQWEAMWREEKRGNVGGRGCRVGGRKEKRLDRERGGKKEGEGCDRDRTLRGKFRNEGNCNIWREGKALLRKVQGMRSPVNPGVFPLGW